jgi:hypothetical protein
MSQEAQTIAGRGAVRSRDFAKIATQFDWYYCHGKHPCNEGQKKYYDWLNALGLDESKPYSHSQESFRWAKDMISLAKEDEEAKYYKVLVGFPLESMNGNVYTEEELRSAVSGLKGKVPNLNHIPEYRLEDKALGLKAETVDAKYEDGACEALLRVPRRLKCPECSRGKTMCDLLDEKKIVNVSLEAKCRSVGPANACLGMEFETYALLTVDTLPGIPLARIFPIEKLIDVTPKGAKPRMVEVKIKLESENPSGEATCPEGMIWDTATGTCVPKPADNTGDEAKNLADPATYRDANGGVNIALVQKTLGKLDETPGIPDAEKEKIRAMLQSLLPKEEEPEKDESLDASVKVSELELKNFKAEQRAKSLEEQVKNAELQYKKELQKTIKLSETGKAQKAEITRLEKALDAANKEALDTRKDLLDARDELRKARNEAAAQISTIQSEARGKVLEAEAETKKVRLDAASELEKAKTEAKIQVDAATRSVGETAVSRDEYKRQMEAEKNRADDLDKKYLDALNANRELSKKIVDQNEALLGKEKELVSKDEDLAKAKRLGKVIATIS